MTGKKDVEMPELSQEWYDRLAASYPSMGTNLWVIRTMGKVPAKDQTALYRNFRDTFPDFAERFPTYAEYEDLLCYGIDPDEVEYEDPWIMDTDLKGWYSRCGDKPHPAYFLLPVEMHESLTREEKMELTRLASTYVGRSVGPGRSFAVAKKAKFQGVTQKLFTSVRRAER